jgi:signal transduction histidine kinase/CheY-like chemotaxis protein
VKKKIVVSLALLFAIFASGAIIASWYVASTTEQLQELLDLHEVEALRRDLVISVRTVQGDLYTARTPLAPRLDDIVANVASLEEASNECAGCHHSPDVGSQLSETRSLIEDYKSALSAYITASANRKRIGSIQREAAGIGDRILERTESMSERASLRLDEITANAAARIKDVRIILLATLAITICLVVVVSSLLVRAVTRPIQRLVGATRIIASGELGHRIAIEEKAEFGELGRNFNAMSAALEKSYQELKSTNLKLQREIGERKQAEKEQQELQKQLLYAQKMEALGTLSTGIAHEFGNFLQIILGCVDRLTSRRDGADSLPAEVDMIASAARRGGDLTRRLLTFASKVETQPTLLDLNEQICSVKTILERTLPETIVIETKLSEELHPIQADAAQIEQIILNLALNARDAMPEGGRLRIETLHERAEGRHGRSHAGAETGDWAVLRISDTGQGMDAGTIRQIFDPFFTTKEVGLGTGLGLATVYGIVTGYGGQIGCTSEIGRGTTFEIRLPALSNQSGSVEANQRATRPTYRGNARVLLVDDESIMLLVMKQNLEELGYVVHTAESGEAALAFFNAHAAQIDLVVLDVGMPGIGGRACLAKLLQLDPNAKVIISTGYGAPRDEDEMRRAGARGFLAKPYQISEIVSEIEKVMSG